MFGPFAIYGATGVVFLLVDGIWLSLAGDRFYRPMLGDMLAPQFRLLPAIVFYLIYVAGLVVFAVVPALRAGDWRDALHKGAMFGFFAYATYDLTNQATLRHWPALVTIVDMSWGTFVSALASLGGWSIARHLLRGRPW